MIRVDYTKPYAGWKSWLVCAFTGLWCIPICCPLDYHELVVLPSVAPKVVGMRACTGAPKLEF